MDSCCLAVTTFVAIVGLPEHLPVHFHAPSRHQLGGPVKLARGRFLGQKLSGLQKADEPVAQPHRHGGVEQSGLAGDRLRFIGGFFAKLFPHLQTGGARVAFLRHQRAKGIFVPLAVMRQLPGFHRLQRHRQARQHVERALILLINLRIRDGLDQGAVVGASCCCHCRSSRRPGFWLWRKKLFSRRQCRERFDGSTAQPNNPARGGTGSLAPL